MTETTSPAHLIRTPSPLGRLEVTGDDRHITALAIESAGALPHDALPENPSELLEAAVAQLAEYFVGERRRFDLPISAHGTPFQKGVWACLDEVGWGEHITYGTIAAVIGRPRGGRAVGRAIRANPVPILVGCHRVLSPDGLVRGYSHGAGIPTKLWLLEHERIDCRAPVQVAEADL